MHGSDNVGAEHLEAALEVMRDQGRVVACGTISGYDVPPEERYGVKNLFLIVAKSITFQGFITNEVNFPPPAFDECRDQLVAWLASGEMKETVTIAEGFDKTPDALLGLFAG